MNLYYYTKLLIPPDKEKTGFVEVIELDQLILLKLDLKSLGKVFAVSPYISSIYKSEYFWKRKVAIDFDEDTIKSKPQNETFREQYKFIITGEKDQIKLAIQGRLDRLKWLYSKGKLVTKLQTRNQIANAAANRGNFSLLHWLLNLGFMPNPVCMVSAARNGELEMMKFLVDRYGDNFILPNAFRCANEAANYGKVEVVKWIYFVYDILPHVANICEGMRYDFFEVVKFLLDFQIIKSVDMKKYMSQFYHSYSKEIKWLDDYESNKVTK